MGVVLLLDQFLRLKGSHPILESVTKICSLERFFLQARLFMSLSEVSNEKRDRVEWVLRCYSISFFDLKNFLR